jgi:DinB superfamily
VLTSVEVREAVERAKSLFIDACAGGTDGQWRFRPEGSGQDGWNMPQVVEHVTFANKGVLRLLREVVLNSPRDDRPLDYQDDDMPYLFYGGAGPAPPDGQDPQGTPADRDDSIEAFRASMDALLDWYDSNDVDLRAYAVRHPALGLFDGAQWLLFAAAHARSHRGQLLDVRIAADEAGPAALPFSRRR